MPKRKRAKPKYEVIDDALVKAAIDQLVDFCEEKKLTAKVVMLAMEIIVDKIKSHLQIESVTVKETSDKLH